MATRLVLHIGAMKSGTSFIQAVCDHNREALQEQGVSFVRERWKMQVDAVKEFDEVKDKVKRLAVAGSLVDQ